jgi:hypothetical protein
MSRIITIQAQQKWEYCYLTRKTEGPLLAEFNRLGQDGWELLDVLYYKDMKGVMNWTGFLKRPSNGPVPGASGQETVAAAAPQAEASRSQSPQHEGFDLGEEEFKLQPD